MDKLKILVAIHKQSPVFQNDIYMPIQVGKAISRINLGFQGDNTGDNISNKNPYYCELTAQYWGWKNLDTEFIGLCHYRRYFEKQFTLENIDAEMDNYDIILPHPLIRTNNLLNFWMHDMIPEDIVLFHSLMLKETVESEKKYFEFYFTKTNKFYPCNMFVCRKVLFDEFAAWQFGILSKLEELLPFTRYSRENRILGYLGEALLPYYAHLHNWKIKTYPLVPMVGEHKKLFHQSVSEKIMNNMIFRLRNKDFIIDDAIRIGLKNDQLL